MRSKITSSGVPAPVNYASVAIPPAIPDFFSVSSMAIDITALLYRPRFLGHRIEAYAAMAAV
jgi:hypothetical protein